MKKQIVDELSVRLDNFISSKEEITRSQAQKIIALGVLVNGTKVTKNGYALKCNDEVVYEEEKKEVIMKYYSSIFDKSSSMIAEKEEPVKKYKWASSIDDQTIEEKLHFKDSLDPVHIDAINTWSKIVSNAMLYNFATKIAIEESNNYIMDIDGNLIPDPGKPDTNHLCTCGCEDETECTCGWKDRQK